MVKAALLFLMLSSAMLAEYYEASNPIAKNVYERECVQCHERLPVSLQSMFMKYLLVYGGEKNFKAGLKHYLKYPSEHITVMSKLFIDNYNIKNKTDLSDEVLTEAIDIYWEKFKVFNKLK